MNTIALSNHWNASKGTCCCPSRNYDKYGDGKNIIFIKMYGLSKKMYDAEKKKLHHPLSWENIWIESWVKCSIVYYKWKLLFKDSIIV